MRDRIVTILAVALMSACGSSPAAPEGSTPVVSQTPPIAPAVYVTLFTHIEENAPAGDLNTAANRNLYVFLRTRMLDFAARVKADGLKWSLEPDWKVLECAMLYEDSALMANTNGMNVFKYLKDVLGVAIDPHSHQGAGYNYSDVAYLLDRLGVGGSAVMSGHVWARREWEVFRSSVAGSKYPSFSWRATTLMGAGTENHVSDPVLTGVWRPRDGSTAGFFIDDPAGNIVSIGDYRHDLDHIAELRTLYVAGTIPVGTMLTSSYHVMPAELTADNGPANLETAVLSKIRALGSQVVSTDFTSVVNTWRTSYASRGLTYIVSQ